MRLPLKTLAINVAVVTALVGGTTAYATYDNTVTLSVDGKAESVTTFADTVGEVLADQDIELGSHDVVAPSADSPVEDDSEIAVRFGRQLTVTVDGVERVVWTTALSVDEALEDMGIRAAGVELSVSRSLGIGRRGLDFEVRTAKDLTLVADGQSTADHHHGDHGPGGTRRRRHHPGKARPGQSSTGGPGDLTVSLSRSTGSSPRSEP